MKLEVGQFVRLKSGYSDELGIGKSERIFHEETQELIEFYLKMIANKGINYFCKNWSKDYKPYEYVNGRLQG